MSSDVQASSQPRNQEVRKVKDAADDHLRHQRYEEAIDGYRRAIIMQPTYVALFSNRARCFLRLERFVQAIDDCDKVVSLTEDDSRSEFKRLRCKAFVMKAQAHLALENTHLAARMSDRAYDVACKLDDSSSTLKAEVAEIRQQCKRRLYHHVAERRVRERSELRQLLDQAVHMFLYSQTLTSAMPEEQKEEHFRSEKTRVMEAVDDLFHRAGEREGLHQDIPEHFCCPITYELMKDPVVTPSGQTYERTSIVEHLAKSQLDPLTNTPLRQSDLAPNFALRDAIQHFLQHNPWADAFDPNFDQ